jgi:hypothetical protein
MIDYIILAVACFGIGAVTGVALVMTILVKAMKGIRSSFKPPFSGGG